MESKTQRLSDSEGESMQNISGLKALEKGIVFENTKQSPTKVTPSLSYYRSINSECSALDGIGEWLSRLKETPPGTQRLIPVPDKDTFGLAGDCAIQLDSSKAIDRNSEPLQVERSSTPIPEPEESWIDDGDLGCLQNVNDGMKEKREVRERSRPIQGMIGMGLNVMRDYFSIGPEATRQKACYAPFFGYLNEGNHQDEGSNKEEFRFDKMTYLKMFVHKDALVPSEQPEHIGYRVLDEAVLWPNDPGSNVPYEDISLESTALPPDLPRESEELVSDDLSKINEPTETDSQPAIQLKLLVPPPDEVRDGSRSSPGPVQDCKTSQAQVRFNVQEQAEEMAPLEVMNEPTFTFTAKPVPQPQNGRILRPSQLNSSILGPSQLKRSIPGPCKPNESIPGPSHYGIISRQSHRTRIILGPSTGHPNPTDPRYQQCQNTGKVLGVTSTMMEQSRFVPAGQSTLFHSAFEMRGQPIKGSKTNHSNTQRFGVDIGTQPGQVHTQPGTQVHTAQQQSRQSTGGELTSCSNPIDLRDKLNAKMALGNSSTSQETSSIPSHSTLFSDTDSSDDEGGPRRRRFMRTVVSTPRRRLFSLSKGLLPQDNLDCADTPRPEPNPKPPVEVERERNVDEWGEELDYERGSDDEESDAEKGGDRIPTGESEGAACVHLGEVHKLTLTFGNQRI